MSFGFNYMFKVLVDKDASYITKQKGEEEKLGDELSLSDDVMRENKENKTMQIDLETGADEAYESFENCTLHRTPGSGQVNAKIHSKLIESFDRIKKIHWACTRYDKIVEQHDLEGIAKPFTEVAAAKSKVAGRRNVAKRHNLGMLVN